MLNEEETIEVDILDNDTLSVDIETGGSGGSSVWGSITGNIQNQTDLMSKFAEKQDNLVSGTNIKTINNQSILGSGNISIGGGGGSTYTAGDNIQISEDNVISATDTIYDDTEVRGLINNKQDKLTAGTGIEITAQNVINNTQTSAEWGNITGTLNDQTDLKNALDSKANSSDIPDVSNFITKDVNNLTYYTLSTDTGSTIELTINQSTYVMTLNLKNSSGTTISTGSIDLPLETMVVGGSYDSQNKKIILTLKNGQTVEFSVADLVSGLQSEITSSNKLSSDLVDDTNKTNKFVTANEKSNWNAKASNDIVIIGDETEATEDTKLIIEEDDMNLDLQGSDFLNEYSESTEKGYSANYVNNQLKSKVNKGEIINLFQGQTADGAISTITDTWENIGKFNFMIIKLLKSNTNIFSCAIIPFYLFTRGQSDIYNSRYNSNVAVTTFLDELRAVRLIPYNDVTSNGIKLSGFGSDAKIVSIDIVY